MAELLVKRTSNGAGPGHWQPGDAVVVMPDGHEWGSEEGLPKFYVIKIPQVSVEKLQKYLEDGTDGRRRRWRIMVDEMTPGAKQLLESKGGAVIRGRPDHVGNFDFEWSEAKVRVYDFLNGIYEDEELA